MIKVFICFIILTFFSWNASADWINSPLSNFGFVANNDRYESIMDEEILFYTNYGSYKLFFFNDAFVVGTRKKRSANEEREYREKIEHGGQAEPEEWFYYKMEFQGANATSTVESINIKSHTLNYQDSEHPELTKKAHAFDHLIYKDIYSNIDMKVELHTQGGLKYTFIVRPGADASLIRMKYVNIDPEKDEKGRLILKNALFNLADSAPISAVDDSIIISAFELDKNEVSFSMDAYDHTKELIIDPWLTAPNDTLDVNKVYDITADNFGNCSVTCNLGEMVALYNSSGVLEWIYDFGYTNSPGDITVKPETGEIFMVNALGFTVRKFEMDGTLIISTNFAPFPMTEGFRIKYDPITDQVYLGGGGVLPGTPQIVVVNVEPVTAVWYATLFFDGYNDLVFLEIDPITGDVYFMVAQESYLPGDGNIIYKQEGDHLEGELYWETPTTHSFVELGSIPYSETMFKMNGFNGMEANETYLYTYDGNAFFQYDKMTGEILDSLTLDQEMFAHGGLALDGCGQIYLGTSDSILVFNEELEQFGGYALPDSCYDIVINGDFLYACGKGFVTQIKLPGDFSIIATPDICGICNGTVTINPESGYPPFEYTMNAETNETGLFFDLCEGTYSLNIVDSLGCSTTLEVIVGAFNAVDLELVSVASPTCHDDTNGEIHLTIAGDTSGVSITWIPENETGGYHQTNLAAGEYTIIANAGDCSDTLVVVLENSPEFVFSELGSRPPDCKLYSFQTGNGVVFAAASGGVPDYTYEWVNLGTGENSTNSTWGGLSAGSYQINIVDANGCELAEILTLEPLVPTASFEVVSDQLNADLEGTELVIAEFHNQSTGFTNAVDPLADTLFYWNLDYPTADWFLSTDYFEVPDTVYEGEKIYQVCLVVINSYGCTDTSCQELIVHITPQLTAPNIFSPNEDGANDLFTFEFLTIGIDNFSCQIVNRWGIVVAELDDILNGWDGKDLNGTLCNDGVYFYTYSAVATNGTNYAGQGSVQLAR
ncbi:MAG: T9SS type B sorting domain-containing protein [Crocinitomix sp.]|nr:T9SS type B sorting domain-containing protein [Crocinitomix sp.]